MESYLNIMRRIGLRVTILLCTLAVLEGGARAVRDLRCRFLSKHPEPDVFELYMVGESTPAGEPYDASLAPPQLVSRMFGGRLAGRPIAVVNLAKPAQSLYPQEIALKEALFCRNSGNPGAVLVYSGNNDNGTIFDQPMVERLLERLEGRSQLIEDILFLAQSRGLGPYASSLPAYEFRMRRVIELSLASGLVPVLSTVPSNIAGIDPTLSSTREAPQEARALLAKGDRLLAAGRCREAYTYFRSLYQGHPSLSGYVRYQQAKCLVCLGRFGPARALFSACLSAPPSISYFMRATPAQNDLLRRLAAEYRIPLADSESLFRSSSPRGIVNEDFFADGHHPNIKGHLLIDQAYAQALSRAFSEPITHPIAYEPDVLDKLGFDRPRQVMAFVKNGWWLLCASAPQVYPAQRLAMAQARFESALALEPDNFQALSGLGLALAGPELLARRTDLDWLYREHLIWGGSVTEASLEEFLGRLARAGVSKDLIARIRHSYDGGHS